MTMALPHTKTSGSARMAVVYITVGAILCVWTAIWYIWMNRHPPETDGPYFWCYGFFFTGMTLMIIGLAVGKIGQSARHAEAPPDTSNAQGAAQLQAATPPAVAAQPVSPAAPVIPGSAPALVATAPPATAVPAAMPRT
jgi:hypothetical protein